MPHLASALDRIPAGARSWPASAQASVTELAEPFAMSLPAISKHLKVLEHAGLIARGREAQWRPCRLEAGPLKDVEKKHGRRE